MRRRIPPEIITTAGSDDKDSMNAAESRNRKATIPFDSNSDGIVDSQYALNGGMNAKDSSLLTSGPMTDIPELGSVWLLATVFGLLAAVLFLTR